MEKSSREKSSQNTYNHAYNISARARAPSAALRPSPKLEKASEFRHAAANAHTTSDPLFSDLVRVTALLGSHGDPLSGSARNIEA